MKDQVNVFFPKFTSTVEMFANENYLDEPQNSELKKTIICSIKEFRV